MSEPTVPFLFSYALLWGVVILLALVSAGLIHVVYELQRAYTPVTQADTGGPQAGQPLPPFEAADLNGSPISTTALLGKFTALLFVSPTCASCTTTLEELTVLRAKSRGSVVLVCRGARDDCRRLAARYGLDLPTIADENNSLGKLIGVPGVPFAVVVDEVGKIAFTGSPQRAHEVTDRLEPAVAAQARAS